MPVPALEVGTGPQTEWLLSTNVYCHCPEGHVASHSYCGGREPSGHGGSIVWMSHVTGPTQDPYGNAAFGKEAGGAGSMGHTEGVPLPLDPVAVVLAWDDPALSHAPPLPAVVVQFPPEPMIASNPTSWIPTPTMCFSRSQGDGHPKAGLDPRVLRRALNVASPVMSHIGQAYRTPAAKYRRVESTGFHADLERAPSCAAA